MVHNNLTDMEPLLREPEPELVAAYGVVAAMVAFVFIATVWLL